MGRCSVKDSKVLHTHHVTCRREALHVDEIRNKIAYFSLHEREA